MLTVVHRPSARPGGFWCHDSVRSPETLPPAALSLARRQEQLIDSQQLQACGVNRSRISRNVGYGTLRRVGHGIYDLIAVPPEQRTMDPDPERNDLHQHRRRRGAWLGLLRYGPRAVAVGQTALLLHGVEGLPVEPRVEVSRQDRRERTSFEGVTLRRYVSFRHVADVGGRRVAPIQLALAQAVPTLERREAVAVHDSALHRRLVNAVTLREAHDLARGRRGVERTHPWWDLTDGRAESPAETWARLSCLDAGAPPDALQHLFYRRDGSVAARVDLAWHLPDGHWFICEIDGRTAHESPQALLRDRRRQNELVAAGHRVVRFTGADAYRDLPGAAIRAHLQRLGWVPGGRIPPVSWLD
ncbi:hypothetical protein GCM10023216_22560 [Isoptericola chiayiensis]|uniref:DUF559 domain-containing protein n=2 Tax=Isoptericola chiayiensis TaxID=579446 RepID=A0ABP8YHI7_9MICO